MAAAHQIFIAKKRIIAEVKANLITHGEAAVAATALEAELTTGELAIAEVLDRLLRRISHIQDTVFKMETGDEEA